MADGYEAIYHAVARDERAMTDRLGLADFPLLDEVGDTLAP